MIRDFAAIVTEFGTVRRTPIEVRNKLRVLSEELTTPQFEHIGSRYSIELAQGGKLT